MAQYRQSGLDTRVGVRGGGSDHVSIGVGATRGSGTQQQHKQSRIHRRFSRTRKTTVSVFLLILSLIFLISASIFLYLSTRDNNKGENDAYSAQDDDLANDPDFLTNVTRKVLKFGRGSVKHGGDSRYWDRDDRRRDEDYSEDLVEHSSMGAKGAVQMQPKGNNSERKSSVEYGNSSNHKGVGLYNEAGRNELKMYEAQYEASLKMAGQSRNEAQNLNQVPNHTDIRRHDDEVDDDEYDDEIDTHDAQMEDYDDAGQDNGRNSNVEKSHGAGDRGAFDPLNGRIKGRKTGRAVEEASLDLSNKASLKALHSDKLNADAREPLRRSNSERRSASKKKPKRRKFSGPCEMKFLNSTAQLVEPLESRKFARFSLQYTEKEDNPYGLEPWEPRFAGHQSLQEREQSYIARDQKINCGFVKGPKAAPSTGFDLAADDAKYISTCHIAVISCIFGNSDHLRTPMGKTVSRLSRKNVCFVMFVDEVTLQTLSAEGQMPDGMGFIGIWKIVVIKNLPNTDMRRVGKIPKLLPHRLFPSARYSIWLDSKLRLQLDPLLILEYFLWRKGHEYAISNHYDRHCVWEEVAQNKKLNKYNHTVIDEQFAFYQADGLKRFNPLDPNKLLPSNVPEGSFIVRAHTPMSNLFSCLWFNEVERFTPRDQLSFAYTYQKLRRMNPAKPFYLNMFKDCERRKIAKLFRHRSEEEKRNIPGNESE